MSILARRFPGAAATAVLALSGFSTAQTKMLEFAGTYQAGFFGTAVAGLGDVDADGLPDLLVSGVGSVFVSPGHARVHSGRDGSVLHAVTGTGPCYFGSAVAVLGDMNGDGTREYAVGAPGHPSCVFGPPTMPGQVSIFSGRTGALVMAMPGLLAGDSFGQSLAAIGDLNGDGLPELLVGAPGNVGSGGYVQIRNGANGIIMRTHPGLALGRAVAGAGDVDGDAVPDYLVSRGRDRPVDVRSGATGALLRQIAAPPPPDGFGVAVSAAGDVDGDGFADVAIGADQSPGYGPGYVRVYSGLDGSILRTISGTTVGDNFGTALALIGDVDGDAVPELAAGAPQAYFFGVANAYVAIISGATGSVSQTVRGPYGSEWFGISVSDAGDVNGDGVTDLILGSPREPVPAASQVGTGRAKVYSLAPLPAASVASVGSGCSVGPPVPQLISTLPVLGQLAGIAVMNAVPNKTGLIYASAVPAASLVLGQGCTVHLDPATLWVLAPFITNAGGFSTTSIPLGILPSAAGAQFALQAAIFPTAGPFGFDLTNGLVVTLGY